MILVTGGTGLVGSHLLFDLVKKGEKLRAIYRNESKIKDVEKVFSYYSNDSKKLIEQIDWMRADMLDLYSLSSAFKDVTQVYHCAAVVSFDTKNKSELIDANVKGTENVVNLCLEKGIEKLCHVSSIASLGEPENGELIDENVKWSSSKNRSAYSISKFQSEMEVWRGVQEGLNAVIVNPSVILGPGFWSSGSGILFKKAASGMKYYTMGGTGFVDVRDVSKIMVDLMDSDVVNERFIINSENLIYRDAFGVIADSVGAKKPNKNAKLGLLKIASALDSFASGLRLKKREITKEVIKSSLNVSQYSSNKIKETLSYDFITIKDSISDIAKIFKKEITIR